MNPYAARLTDDQLVIFLLHGVVERSDTQVRNYTRKHLEATYFREVMRLLRDHGSPISMEAVIDHHRRREHLPPRSFAVTFDDGFENNYSVAAPILDDLGIPATFYVTTGFVDENAMSWIDRIEYCFEALPEVVVSLPWSPEPRRYTNAQDKIALLDEIRSRVKSDTAIDVEAFVADVFAQCGIPETHSSDHPLDLKLSWDQVCELHHHHGFTLGGHSHNHSILTFLSDNDLDKEVSRSLALLKDRAGVGPEHYSYPEGLEHCYSETVIRSLKFHGVECCPTAIDGVNDVDTDLFHLRRVNVT